MSRLQVWIRNGCEGDDTQRHLVLCVQRYDDIKDATTGVREFEPIGHVTDAEFIEAARRMLDGVAAAGSEILAPWLNAPRPTADEREEERAAIVAFGKALVARAPEDMREERRVLARFVLSIEEGEHVRR